LSYAGSVVTVARDQRSQVVFTAGTRVAHLRGCARLAVPRVVARA